MKLRDFLHAERREENARVHAMRVAVWESEQPKAPICGWDVLLESLWANHADWLRERVEWSS